MTCSSCGRIVLTSCGSSTCRSDADGKPAGKRLVNDVDYAAAAATDPSVVPLRVRLPEASGNQVPSVGRRQPGGDLQGSGPVPSR